MEISSLQKRLEAPSEDEIEWRVAYDEAKEALEQKMAEGETDISDLAEKKRQLEDTVDHLCVEKGRLLSSLNLRMKRDKRPSLS